MKKGHLLSFMLLAGGIVATAPSATAQLKLKRASHNNGSAQVGENARILKKAGDFNPDSSLYSTWNGGSEKYDPTMYNIYTYDGDGNPTIELIKDPAGDILMRRTNKYTNGKLTEAISEMYDPMTDTYSPSGKYTMLYDDKGNEVSYKFYTYNSSSYIMSSGDSSQYIYNGSGQLTSVVNIGYEGGEWINSYKTELIYDGAEPAPGSALFYEWDEDKEEWEQEEKLEGIKWGLGFSSLEVQPTAYFTSEWDGTQWLPSSYDSLVHSNGRADQYLSYEWDGTDITLVYKSTYTYDSKGNLFSDIEEGYSDGEWMIGYGSKDSTVYGSLGEKLEIYSMWYDSDMEKWENGSKITNFFRPNLSVKKSIADQIRVYPNPAGNKFFIEKRAASDLTVRIFSLQGAEIGRLTVSDDIAPVSTDGWNSGIYFIHLESTEGTATQKIVIR